MCAGQGGRGVAPRFQAVSGEAGCAGLESSQAHGWRPHLESQALDTMGGGHMAQDGTLGNTDSKEPQRRSVSNVKRCGTPSKIRTEKHPLALWCNQKSKITSDSGPSPPVSAHGGGARNRISSFPLGKRSVVPRFWALQRGQEQPLWFEVLVSWETKGPFNDPFQSVRRNPLRWEGDGYRGPQCRDDSGQLKLSPWGL